MRSSKRTTHMTSSPRRIVRGSSIMNVMHWRWISSYSSSTTRACRAGSDLADLLAFIADTLKVRDGLDGRDDHAQVPGRGRARRQDAAALLVDRDFHAVDFVVILRHRASERAVAVHERREAAPELLLDEPSHRQHLGANALEFLVETLGGVVREISGFHDSLAVATPNSGAALAHNITQ